MKTLSKYPEKIYIGTVDNEKVYLSAPSWDCGWYWGFGYLGNKNCHYHVDGLTKHETCDPETKGWKTETTNLYDGFLKHFNTDFIVRKSALWTLCELFKTFYTLKEAAEVLGRGGSHYASNPCKDVIVNKKEVDRINNEVLPAIFEEIYKILIRSQDNKKIDKELVRLNTEGDTLKVVAFMFENAIHTDDLKDIKELSDDDRSVIHGYYWEQVHKSKQK